MNNLVKTRRFGRPQLGKPVRAPEPVVQALATILENYRAWDQFRGKVSDLVHVRKNQHQSVSKREVDQVETEARKWLDLAESAEISGAFSRPECFLLRVFAVERVHEQRWLDGFYVADLADIDSRMDSIRQREKLNHDEYWPIGQGPEDWEELSHQYEQVLDAKFEETLREYGLDDIADLYHSDRKLYDDLREKGRRLVFKDIPELERLSAAQQQFELEAGICAQGGAYHAAVVMIGAAIEATLMFACLNRLDDALNARDRLSADKRPARSSPKRWNLQELAIVAEEAGWLPGYELVDGTFPSPAPFARLFSRPLVDMVRKLRNLVHPRRHLSNSTVADVEREYANARAAYTLLKWHLSKLHVTSNEV